MAAIGKKLGELNDIIIALRKPDGCPWDRKQTPQTFKSYLLEESHELLEAIDADDPGLVKEELGDMLFQILFINLLYEEKGLFTLQDVISTISDKMVRRHPHVFGGEKVQSEADQRLKWNQIKAREKKTRKKAADLLFGVPLSLPGLRRAQRVSERAAHNGFEWQDLEAALEKLTEEVAELKEAISSKNRDKISEELGDALFVLVNLGRLTELNSEDALHAATDKFIKRFSLLEQRFPFLVQP